MSDDTGQADSGDLQKAILGVLVVVILIYSVVTAETLFGVLASATIVFGFYFVRWISEMTHLFRRLVVALERIAEND